MRLLLLAVAPLLFAGEADAVTMKLEPVIITEWKAVYGTIEARNTVPARARIGGTVADLRATEGDVVKAGQKIATVEDEKLAFQIAALDAQIGALRSQLTAAQADLIRGESLVSRGIVTQQKLDELRSQTGVLQNQISAMEAQRSVVVRQQSEGEVDAPSDGKILTVPITRGAVIMAGETVAIVGGGGLFLRLAVPERHAGALKQGADIRVSLDGRQTIGKLAKIYPQIENGRVIADVEAGALDTTFVNARVLVQLPVGERQALLVPASAIATHDGVDFVSVNEGAATLQRVVIASEVINRPDGNYREVLTGLAAGDEIVLP
ncbi:efflux RND transporter periplasmic adaptor subunit [Rhizobium sp. P40RR-XXII]|nr:efflux RND transporter periplasmic adaptor subunit [Rhizobium sp. P40RR-XXII]